MQSNPKNNNHWTYTVLFLCLGEYIELVTFAFLTPTIGILFFHNQSAWLQQLYSICLFSAAYIVRPIGGYVVGYFSDIYGRKQGLIMISLIGAIASFCIGLLPTHSATGLVLLVSLRLIQGFTMSNESTLVAIWLYENTPSYHQWISYLMGILALATIMAMELIHILETFLSKDSFLQWGWRIPFLMSGIIIGLTFWIRRYMPEQKISTMNIRQNSPWPYFFISTALASMVMHYMYLPKYIPAITHKHLLAGWVISIITALAIAKRVPSIKSATFLSVLIFPMCYFFRQNAWALTCMFQLSLTVFAVSSYCWIVKTLPSSKLGRLFGLYSQIGSCTAAGLIPITVILRSLF